MRKLKIGKLSHSDISKPDSHGEWALSSQSAACGTVEPCTELLHGVERNSLQALHHSAPFLVSILSTNTELG